MKKIFLDTQALQSGHAHRGIGAYTRSLQKALRQQKKIQVLTKADQADLIHYPYFDFFTASLKTNTKIPVVVTIHDVIPLQFPHKYKAGIKGTIALWRQKFALKKVAAIITDSQASKQEIVKRLGIPSQKINVVPLAASEELKYQDIKNQQKITLKYDLPTDFLLYVGDINYNKNLPMLVEAFAQLRQSNQHLQLVMVGKNFKAQPIPEWKALTDAITKHKLESSVRFLPTVESLSDLASVYSQAKLYIQPSLAEGFGLPILEAMSCLCPVVCFRQSSMVEVGGEHAVYPTAVSARSLATAIEEVLSWSGTVRHRWVLQAYSWSTTFSWKATAQETVAVYESI